VPLGSRNRPRTRLSAWRVSSVSITGQGERECTHEYTQFVVHWSGGHDEHTQVLRCVQSQGQPWAAHRCWCKLVMQIHVQQLPQTALLLLAAMRAHGPQSQQHNPDLSVCTTTDSLGYCATADATAAHLSRCHIRPSGTSGGSPWM
jgi:hypothetical protein